MKTLVVSSRSQTTWIRKMNIWNPKLLTKMPNKSISISILNVKSLSCWESMHKSKVNSFKILKTQNFWSRLSKVNLDKTLTCSILLFKRKRQNVWWKICLKSSRNSSTLKPVKKQDLKMRLNCYRTNFSHKRKSIPSIRRIFQAKTSWCKTNYKGLNRATMRQVHIYLSWYKSYRPT